jgi:radical SAM protein with 4Fe4S-binding SPASM domain
VSAAAKSYAKRLPSGPASLWKSGGPLLAWLDIELTERCNNDCVHCNVNRPANDREAEIREMTTEDIKSILREAAALGCLTVRFTGGEPLLRDDFEDLYLHARRLGIRVMIFTNATLVTPDFAALLTKVPPGETMEVSIYGMGRESAESVTRTPGSFAAARRGVDLLARSGIRFAVKGALLPANKEEIKEFETWARRISDMTEKPSFAMFFDLRARRDGDKNDAIRSLRISPEEAVGIQARQGPAAADELLDFAARFSGAYGDRLFPCLSGGRKASVDAYGELQPCLLLKHPATAYRLKEGSLREALVSHLAGLRELRTGNPDYLSRCGRCFLKSLCLQCPAKSWAEHGTLDTPVEYFCAIAHAQARSLGLLKEGESAWAVGDWRERVKAALRESSGSPPKTQKLSPGHARGEENGH